MNAITPEKLKAVGFEAVDRDKLTIKYELRTRWQTVTLWRYTLAHDPYGWTLGGITHHGDRATVDDIDQLIEIAKAFGANAETYAKLAALND